MIHATAKIEGYMLTYTDIKDINVNLNINDNATFNGNEHTQQRWKLHQLGRDLGRAVRDRGQEL